MNSHEKSFFDSFRNAVKTIHSTLDLGEVLKGMAKTITQMISARGCAIYLFDPNRRTLELVSYHGLSPKYIGKGSIDADLSIPETMEGKSVLIFDATKDPRVQYKKEAIEEGICSIFSVPLFIEGRVIGVIRLYTSEPRIFSEEEKNFIEAIAEIGAVAVENARRYETIRKDYEFVMNDIFNFFEYRRSI